MAPVLGRSIWVDAGVTVLGLTGLVLLTSVRPMPANGIFCLILAAYLITDYPDYDFCI